MGTCVCMYVYVQMHVCVCDILHTSACMYVYVVPYEAKLIISSFMPPACLIPATTGCAFYGGRRAQESQAGVRLVGQNSGVTSFRMDFNHSLPSSA